MNTDNATILALTLAFLVVASGVPLGDAGFADTAAANHHGGDTYTLRQPSVDRCYEVQTFTHDHEKMVPEVVKRGSIDEEDGDVTGQFKHPDWDGPVTIESIMDYRYRATDGSGQTAEDAPYLNVQYRWEPWEDGTYGLYNWSENGDSHLWFYENAAGDVSLVVRHDRLYENIGISSHSPYNGISGPHEGFLERSPGDGQVSFEFDDLPSGEWAYIDDKYPKPGMDDYYTDGNVRFGHPDADFVDNGSGEPLDRFTGGYFSIDWSWDAWENSGGTVKHGTDGGAYRGFDNLAPGESVTITNSFSGDIADGDWEVRTNDGTTNGVQQDLVMGEPLVIQRGPACTDVSLDSDATDDTAEVGQPVTFAADADGSPDAFRWDFDGDGEPDDETSGPTVTHAFENVTDREVGVTADYGDIEESASVSISVIENQPPTASLDVEPGEKGLDEYHVVGEQLTFDATGSSDNSGQFADEFEWSFGDGTNTTAGDRVTYSFDGVGNYTVEVQVSDAAGNTDTTSIPVEIDAEDTESPTPQAEVTPTEVEAGASLTFDASGSDDNRQIAEYRWDFDGDGEPDEVTDEATVEASPYESAGNYSATLEVVDGAGNVDNATVSGTVTEAQPPDIVDVSVPEQATTGVAFSLAATVEDEGRIAEYRWLVDGEVGATGSEATYTFDEEISETRRAEIQLVVVDAAGERNTTRRTVTVLPPDESPPDAFLSVDDNETQVGDDVTFNASNSTDPPHRDIARYHWDFDGNGTVDSVTDEPVVEHSYGATGTFEALVTVEDGSGNNGTATAVNVTVDEAERAFGGGGGGGGGGSVSVGPPPVVTETQQVGPSTTEVDVRNGRADETVRTDLSAANATDGTGVRFRTLAVNLASDDSHVLFRSAASRAAPEGVPALTDDSVSGPAAPAETLAYLDLGSAYLDATVENATVTFTVSESALGEFPDPTDVSAYRYDGEWTRADATLVDTSDGVYRFETTGDGLGTLAVGASEGLALTDAALANETVTTSERVEATATVENGGPTARTLTLNFTLSGDVVDSAAVEIPAGETREVTLSGTAPTPGTYDASVASASTGTLTVEQVDPADVSVADVSLNRSTIEAGESVEIAATVENAGGEPGEATVTLTMFGEDLETETVEVPADETTQVTFVRQVDAAGSYEIKVGGETATLDVTGTNGGDDGDGIGPSGTGVPGFGVGAALVALLAAALVARRRG
ncbi:PKD domain-containing protein [Halorussus litoreus]|uniref:PKD domain-containing protein n=1 Tax=Halorussus litoreus TaxID=1710536 RepID=UPI000E2701EE|nr:PKD domain-containing protein [Halorussus litoreus]